MACSLEFRNLQHLIYSDLSNNIGECKDVNEVQPTVDLIRASIETHGAPLGEQNQERVVEDTEGPQRVYMVGPEHLAVIHSLSYHDSVQPASRANCHIGFAQVAAKLPDPHVDSVVRVLIEVLRDIPRMDFDQCLVWDGAFTVPFVPVVLVLTNNVEWAIPDQLVYNTVSSLLRLAASHPGRRLSVTDAILEFAERIVTLLQNEHRTFSLMLHLNTT